MKKLFSWFRKPKIIKHTFVPQNMKVTMPVKGELKTTSFVGTVEKKEYDNGRVDTTICVPKLAVRGKSQNSKE